MEDLGRLSRHFWLTQGMARTIGVNLNAALKSGRLTRDTYGETIAHCCACGRAQRCMGWMGRQSAGADRLPRFCEIAPVLEQLKN